MFQSLTTISFYTQNRTNGYKSEGFDSSGISNPLTYRGKQAE